MSDISIIKQQNSNRYLIDISTLCMDSCPIIFQKSFLQTKPLEALSIKLPIHAQVSNPSSLMLAKPSNGLLFSLRKIETFFFRIWHAKKKQVRKKRRFIAVSVNFGERTLIRPLLRGCLGVGSSRQPLT